MNFTIGDLVELKSGGPAMTVRHVEGDTVSCNWFDETGQVFNCSEFHRDMLVPFVSVLVSKTNANDTPSDIA